MRLALVPCAILVLVTSFLVATGTPPEMLSYQGVLQDGSGAVVPDDDYNITFSIYDVDTGGAVLWTETQTLSVAGGIFDAILGTVTPLALPFDVPYWLGVAVEPEPELAPRTPLSSAPYALNALRVEPDVVSSIAGVTNDEGDVDLVAGPNITITPDDVANTITIESTGGGGDDGDWEQSGGNVYRLLGNVGIGTAGPEERLDVEGTIQATGLKLPSGAIPGYVLTSDPDGVGTWQPAGGGDITAVYAENGLTGGAESGDAYLNVGAGDGINVTPDEVSVDVTDIAGLGLGEDAYNNLEVNVGAGLAIDVDAVALLPGYIDGSVHDARFVNEGQADAVTVDMVVPDIVSSIDGVVNDGGDIDLVAGPNITITPDDTGNTITFEATAGGGDDGDWTIDGDDMYTTVPGNVGVGTTVPHERFHIHQPLAGERSYLQMTNDATGPTAGDGTIFGLGNDGSTYLRNLETDKGVYIGTEETTRLAVMATGEVGIGTTSPLALLDVAGTARVEGFEMPTGASDGYVLTSDGAGEGVWQAAPDGDDGDWVVDGDDMEAGVPGVVAVGTPVTPWPEAKLRVNGGMIFSDWSHTDDQSPSVLVMNYTGGGAVTPATGTHAIWGAVSSAGPETKHGVTGIATGDDGDLYGVSGIAALGVGNLYGVYGSAPDDQSTSWAGYFDGHGYFDGDLGVGTTTPNERLHVHEPAAGSAAYLQTTNAATGTLGTDGLIVGVNPEGHGYIWNQEDLGNIYVGSYVSAGLTVYHNGAVGIGTTAPKARMHVHQPVGGFWSDLQLTCDETGAQSGDGVLLSIGATGDALLGNWEPGGDFSFRTEGNTRMTLASSGGVGIGTTTPNHMLEVRDGGVYVEYSNENHWDPALHAVNFNGTTSFSPTNGTRAAYFATTSDGTETKYAVAATAGGNGGTKYGIYARATGVGTNWAGYFNGDAHVTGTLSKGAGSFKIDHPLDPEGKYLYHSFVESPDMKNVYDGVVMLDGSGEAWVELPEWCEALNRDFRYQLTCIGGFAPVYIAQKISDNHFRIAGGEPGMEVSWMVTGIRQDAYAEQNRIPVEEPKPADEAGTYLHPEAFGKPTSMSVDAGHDEQTAE